MVTTFVANYKLIFISFLYGQENQEDLGLWEEKFGKFVDVKANGKLTKLRYNIKIDHSKTAKHVCLRII